MESYDEHRERDSKNALGFLTLVYFFPSLRWLIPFFIAAIAIIWGFNILGQSTILNDKEIYYSGQNPWTGQTEVVKGCRPEHLDINRQCNNEITLDIVKQAFPFFGPARK